MPWALLVALFVGAIDQPLTLEEVLARTRPSAEELFLAADLAETRRELAGTSSWRADAPTLGATVGARRAEGSTRPDVELELDWPLLARPTARQLLVDALAAAEATLLGAARLETLGRATAAYRECWAAAARLTLAREDLATVERWAGITARRAEAGAAADFEVDLLSAEVAEARARVALAEAEELRARSALAALVDRPLGTSPLAVPPAPPLPEAAGWEARFQGGLSRRALAAGLALEEGRLALATAREGSRLDLATRVAREGDESVARVGLAYRLFGRQEPAALEAAAEARRQAARRRHAEAAAALDARFEHARGLVSRLGVMTPAAGLDRALGALEARLVEGKATAAEVLALRRSVGALRRDRLDHDLALLAARQELSLLTTEVNP
ncbi:MAG TPA: TolC family protein [Thermoanaerobaculia bacterium]|nr:TolC family protein [Thermoanaerobaculia bacterium]